MNDANRFGVRETLKKQAHKIQARWRKAVTGNAEKRVRDHFHEKKVQPKYVKLLDKVGFTLGVLNIAACQYFLLNIPAYFPAWYTVIVPLLLTARYFHFRSLNWHYFMIDFCYFVLLLSLVNITIARNSWLLFKVVFIFATGVLPASIPIWRNSFIFHDFDKIISVYIHILPCMLYYTLRWGGALNAGGDWPPLTLWDYFAATVVYAFWQSCYLYKTEVIDKDYFDANPAIVTSLRWLTKDTKNATSKFILKLVRKIGAFAPTEDYDSKTMKTKLVFVVSQFIITIVTCLPSVIFYHSGYAMLGYIFLIFIISVYNGASFYIDVFSVRYQQQIKELEQMHHITQDASQIMKKFAVLDLPSELLAESGKDSELDGSSPISTTSSGDSAKPTEIAERGKNPSTSRSSSSHALLEACENPDPSHLQQVLIDSGAEMEFSHFNSDQYMENVSDNFEKLLEDYDKAVSQIDN